jgi:hypothetical protein
MGVHTHLRAGVGAVLLAALTVVVPLGAPASADATLVSAQARLEACGDVVPSPTCKEAVEPVPPAFSRTLDQRYDKNGVEHARATQDAEVVAPFDLLATALTRGSVESQAVPGDPDGDDPDAGSARGTADLDIELSISEPTTVWVEGFMQVSQVGGFCSEIAVTVDGAPRFEVAEGPSCTPGLPTQLSVSEELAFDISGSHTISFRATSASGVSGSPSSASGFGRWDLRFGVCSNEFTAGNDTIDGTAADEVICGGDGVDNIDGKGGDDVIFGGLGGDVLLGGLGSDEIDGGPGDDAMHTGSLADGPDDIDDTLRGGTGNDTVSARDDTGTHVLEGNEGRDFVIGGDQRDFIDGGPGHDSGRVGGLDIRLVGGPGNDVLTGSDGDDLVDGGGGHDILSGESGSDKLLGRGGRDCLTGGGRKDVLIGGALNDRLFARDGLHDVVRGGSGIDRARVDAGRDLVTKVERRDLSGSCL